METKLLWFTSTVQGMRWVSRVFALLGLAIVASYAAKGLDPYKVAMSLLLMLYSYAYCHLILKHLQALELGEAKATDTVSLLFQVALPTSMLGCFFARAILEK
jgi:hypothetical protein